MTAPVVRATAAEEGVARALPSARQSRAWELCAKFFSSRTQSHTLAKMKVLDASSWTTKNWHGLQMQRLSVVLHTAVAWQTVNELACGESGIVHGAECIAVLNGVA